MHDPYIDPLDQFLDRILARTSSSSRGFRPAPNKQARLGVPRRHPDPAVQRSESTTNDGTTTKTQPYAERSTKYEILFCQQFRVGYELDTQRADTDQTARPPATCPAQPVPSYIEPYARCIANAAASFTKMQRYTSLSNGASDAGRASRPDHSRPTSFIILLSSSSSSMFFHHPPGGGVRLERLRAHRGSPRRPKPHRDPEPSRPPRTPPC